MAVEGDHNFYFKYQDFDRDFIYISANGPCVIRFIAGRLSDLGRIALKAKYPLISPTAGTGGTVSTIVSLSPYLSVLNPTGPTVTLDLAPAPALQAPKIVATFATDAGTVVGNLVRVNGANSVTKITTNSSATIPNGIFGIVTAKPSALVADVVFIGIQGGYAGFTTGQPLFISTGGVPTHTVPTTGVVQQIGFAVSTTELFIQLMLPTIRS